jgi:hypothetical protein
MWQKRHRLVMSYSSSVHDQARQKHRDNAGEENAVERPGAAD